MPTIEDAIALAVRVHSGQTDKAGAPYILHPLRVMTQMTTEPEQIVAVLHDALEDTSITLSNLREMGFAIEVLQALECLTRDKKAPYMDYIEGIKTNTLAKTVKIADLMDNMNLDRIAHPSPIDFERRAKYEKALSILKAS